MKKGRFDCNDYGDKSVAEQIMLCYDCEKETVQQLAYLEGIEEEKQKVRFCTVCGKTYYHKFVV